jgi:hypothetical protein
MNLVIKEVFPTVDNYNAFKAQAKLTTLFSQENKLIFSHCVTAGTGSIVFHYLRKY